MTQNLNEIFTEANTQTNDGAMVIEIANSTNNKSGSYEVFPENTLAEVINICRAEMGISDAIEKINFEVNGKTYSDPTLTVAEVGLANGTKLLIHPSGRVAAENI